MDSVDPRRRAVVAAILGGTAGLGLFSPARSYLDRFSPLSGSAWTSATRRPQGRVDSEYGDATVTYDEYGVPTVEAEDERSLYYAVGYVHAADRLAQMDLARRQMAGELAEVVGEPAVESDRFHRRMDFRTAAEVTWESLGDSGTAAVVEAYANGVNAYRADGPLPLEFGLLEYEPEPWTPVDTMLMETQISWALTGSFETLRRATLRDALGPDLLAELHPRRYDDVTPILRPQGGPAAGGRSPPGDASGDGAAGRGGERDPGGRAPHLDGPPADAGEVAWLSAFESPETTGSNSWVVSGSLTESGQPILANDPHLSLSVPPVWYEQHLETPGLSCRGVTFPGVPFVIIGENDTGAWGFTNANADVLDCYTYETDGEGRYRYGDEYREFETREETVAVAGGADETVTVKKTVHGPVVTREGRDVAVAWTGLTATDTTRAIREFASHGSFGEFYAATRQFDLPTQNLLYANENGGTYYQLTGRIPRRYTDGEVVPGTRVFDGSSREGEWRGFTPYGKSTWSGFLDFDEKPQRVNPDYVGTANQRIVDDSPHYLAESYSAPARGNRLYERLDALAARGEVTPGDMRDVQRDAVDLRAREFVPVVLAATRNTDLQEFVAPLEEWTGGMTAGDRAPLVFATVLSAYREELFASAFEARGLSEAYWPNDWVAATLGADAAWFGELDRTREAVVRDAVTAARDRVDAAGWETYGDLNALALDHPLGLGFLGYPTVRPDGSGYTLSNVDAESGHGSSFRLVAPQDRERPATGVLPGGNSGRYFWEHYHDQLELWATGEYRELTAAVGDADIEFLAGGDGGAESRDREGGEAATRDGHGDREGAGADDA